MSKNHTLLSNTLFLYLRMLVVIAISLYTTRVVFRVLGIENYGIFNLVASFVALFSFLNSAMQSGTQRFLNVALSSGQIQQVQTTFKAALNIHIGIAAIVFLALETLGLWYVQNKLNIPANKLSVAKIVFQFSIVMTIASIICVPYQAIIVAKERMSLFAYISIFEAFAKLAIALTISFIGFNQLIIYSGALAGLAITVFLIYFFVVIKNFAPETRYRRNFTKSAETKDLTKEILAFSSWNLLGQIAVLSATQGITILYNLFLGITVNAALAIAQQVRGLIGSLANNLQTAFNPQIVQSYTSGDFDRHNELVLNASRYSLYLISIIAIPFLLLSDEILQLWLGKELPQYASFFVKGMIWVTILECLSGPFWMSAHARGNIRNYQIIISMIFLLNVPLTYSIFQVTHSAYWAFMPTIFITLLALVYRVQYFFRGQEFWNVQVSFYFKNIGYIFGFLFLIFFLKPYLSNVSNTNSILIKFLVLVMMEILFLLYIVLLCFHKQENNLIKNYLNRLKLKILD